MTAADDIVRESLERIRQRIDQRITDSGERASGRTQASMHIVPTETGGMLVGRAFFQSVETGRPAGRVPYRFRDIIKQWMLDKGLAYRIVPYKTNRRHKYTAEERSLNMAAGAIAHSIAETGTSLYKAGGRTDIYTEAINEEIPALRKKLAASVAATLSRSLSAAWREHAIGDATYQHLN